MNKAELTELRIQLDILLVKGFIKESKSPLGVPIIFVPKKTGERRIYIDYRRLNKDTVKNVYLLPLIDEIRDRLVGATYFTKVDIRDVYYYIRIKKGNK